MRRTAAIVLLAVVLPVALVAVLGSGAAGDDAYRVRAIFDNAASAVEGEDVKVAGARVGQIESLEVTPDNKAAVVLRIDKPGFDRFRADARCTIRPQSLIGEKFVECDPGSADAPPLRRIPDGEEGAGQYLLPLERTSSPVDLDLINDIMRRPYPERLSLLLAEFGTGLAGRGEELNEAIHRANPALRETDRVLAVLAEQNDVLARLARDAEAVLEPLARERRRVSSFIRQANATAEATAERRDDLRRSVERLPRVLPELRKTLAQLGDFSAQTTPVVRDARRSARDLNRFLSELGPFSSAAIPALQSLGDTADVAGPALDRSRPMLRDLADLGGELRPLSRDLDDLTASLDETGAIERLMDFIFFQVTAINGFDELGHYLRASLLVNPCSTYATEPVEGCAATFRNIRSIRGARASSQRTDPHLAELRSALDRALGRAPAAADSGGDRAAERQRTSRREDPRTRALREAAIERIRESAEPPEPRNAQELLLDWLLGGER